MKKIRFSRKKRRYRHKKKYNRGRDWKKYNERLVNRGQVIFDLEFLRGWNKELKKMNHKKGGKYRYPESYIGFLAFVYFVCGLPFRQTEGFIKGLMKFVPKLKKPHYSTIDRRIMKKRIRLPKDFSPDDVVLVVDATGVKVSNRGEWMRKKYKKKRGFVKIHFAIDRKKRKIISMRVTSEKTGDNKKFKSLIKESVKKGKVVKVLADGAYDAKDNFNLLDRYGIEAGIKVRKNARARSRGSCLRKIVVREQQADFDKWKKRVGYTDRLSVESVISVFKRMFGEFVSAKKFNRMINELYWKANIYNFLLGLGEK